MIIHYKYAEKIIKLSLFVIFISIAVLALVFWELFWGHSLFLKDIKQVVLHKNHSVELRLENDEVIRKSEPKYYHKLQELPQYMIDFLLFQEDQGFFAHSGYSLKNIFIVLYDYVFKGDRLRGASTLTQQLARSLFISREHSIRRKLVELRLARVLEKEFDKEKS